MRVWAIEAAVSLLVVAGAVRLASDAVLTAIGAFLIVEDPLQPVQAIVVLDGGRPFREQEAARLYLAGWAPRVVLTRGLSPSGTSVDRALLLERLGVPAQAITVVEESPSDTREETNALAKAIQPGTSPVILVTSAYHTRRAGLAWRQTTDGRSDAIVRPAWQERVDVHAWWHAPESTIQVWHEYVGLAAYVIGLRGG